MLHRFFMLRGMCVCVVRSDDADILVSRLMRCEDECCCCRDTAGKMTIIMIMIGITLFACGSV